MSFDISLFHLINSAIGRSVLFDGIILFFAIYFIVVALAVFCVAAIRSRARDSKSILLYVVAMFSAFFARFGVASGIRFFYHRPRPFLALDAPHLFTDSAFAFPSGHTIFLFALAAATYSFNKKLGLGIGISGILVGVARVAAGVHYPSDILGGAVLGIIVGAVLQRIILRVPHFKRAIA